MKKIKIFIHKCGLYKRIQSIKRGCILYKIYREDGKDKVVRYSFFKPTDNCDTIESKIRKAYTYNPNSLGRSGNIWKYRKANRFEIIRKILFG